MLASLDNTSGEGHIHVIKPEFKEEPGACCCSCDSVCFFPSALQLNLLPLCCLVMIDVNMLKLFT